MSIPKDGAKEKRLVSLDRALADGQECPGWFRFFLGKHPENFTAAAFLSCGDVI